MRTIPLIFSVLFGFRRYICYGLDWGWDTGVFKLFGISPTLKPTIGLIEFGGPLRDCCIFTIGLSAFYWSNIDLFCGWKSLIRVAKLTEFEVLGCDNGIMEVFEFEIEVEGAKFWEIYNEFWNWIIGDDYIFISGRIVEGFWVRVAGGGLD